MKIEVSEVENVTEVDNESLDDDEATGGSDTSI